MKKSMLCVVCKDGANHKSFPIGNAIMNENNSISPRKYNELKRQAMKCVPALFSGEYMWICTEDGLVAEFGGYPAINRVKFY